MYAIFTFFLYKKIPLSQIISARTLKSRTFLYICILKGSAKHFIVILQCIFCDFYMRILIERACVSENKDI